MKKVYYKELISEFIVLTIFYIFLFLMIWFYHSKGISSYMAFTVIPFWLFTVIKGLTWITFKKISYE